MRYDAAKNGYDRFSGYTMALSDEALE